MGRGLDGYFSLLACVQFSSLVGADRSRTISVVIARGKHLFPFRTEPLSPSAPMVLGGQPPGSAGRRRFFQTPPRRGLFLCPLRREVCFWRWRGTLSRRGELRATDEGRSDGWRDNRSGHT